MSRICNLDQKVDMEQYGKNFEQIKGFMTDEQRIECHRHSVKERKHSTKEVNCVECGRKMTTRKYENPPYYCYKCDDEAEGVWNYGG